MRDFPNEPEKRPTITLLTPEDADKLKTTENIQANGNFYQRPMSQSVGARINRNSIPSELRDSGYSAAHFQSNHFIRPSETYYNRERDSSVSDYSSTMSDISSTTFNHPKCYSFTSGSTAHGRSRLSVSPDINHTFEDMFDTDWEGYIWKQGHVVRSWRYRYAVLSGLSLSYYVSKDVALADTERYRGRVTVTGAKRDENRPNGVLITTSIQKIFSIYTRTPTESEIWIRLIQQAVAYSEQQRQKPSLSLSSSTSASVHARTLANNNNTNTNQSTSNLGISTNALLGQTVRSSGDWKSRNIANVKQFYALWTSVLLEFDEKNDIANGLINLFPICSTDMFVNVQYPCDYLPASTFYGREGLVDVLLGIGRYIRFKQYSVTRYLTTKQPNVLHVIGTGTIYNRSLKRSFSFTSRDEVTLSPGGRVLNLRLIIDVDAMVFQLNENDFRTAKSENRSYFQATTCKRVLSLSIQQFHVFRVLGKGTFGTVVLAERKNTGEVFAVKILEKSSMSNYDKIRTKTEMRILRDVHHPFIAPLKFSFQSPSRVFLGMEYYPGGSLYAHMNRFSHNREHRVKIPLDMARVKFYACQIVLALCHLHACDIVYRDLKPDNIMIDESGNLALVDFGLSKTNVSQISGARTMAGSPAYTAPELLKPKRARDYGKAVDWWCLGILLYEMLLAKRPFHHLNVSVLYKLIEKDPVKFPPKSSSVITPEARSLITGLLEKDPMKRLGARHTSDILKHPFFQDVQWHLVLRKKIQPPWVPATLTLEEEKLKNPDINFDKYLASKTESGGGFLSLLFPWRSTGGNRSKSGRKRSHTTSGILDSNDGFGKFSYVSDTTKSFLIDEDEMLDSAFTGRRSIQIHTLASEA